MTETPFDTANTGMEACAVYGAATAGPDRERHVHVRNNKAACSRIAAAVGLLDLRDMRILTPLRSGCFK
jgi:hypothetical protein